MPATGAADDRTDDDELPVEVRIAAAVTLTTHTPSATALELLEDRRIAHTWAFGLGLAGFGLLALITLTRERADAAAPFAVTVVALAVAAVAGLRRWQIDRVRLRARTADAALHRRERLLLLAGIDRGRQPNRTPLPLLRELAHWRIDAAVPDLLMFGGAATAFYLPGFVGDGDQVTWWQILGGVAIGALVVGAVATTLRGRARCRRFLADSAGWRPAGGTGSPGPDDQPLS